MPTEFEKQLGIETEEQPVPPSKSKSKSAFEEILAKIAPSPEEMALSQLPGVPALGGYAISKIGRRLIEEIGRKGAESIPQGPVFPLNIPKGIQQTVITEALDPVTYIGLGPLKFGAEAAKKEVPKLISKVFESLVGKEGKTALKQFAKEAKPEEITRALEYFSKKVRANPEDIKYAFAKDLLTQEIGAKPGKLEQILKHAEGELDPKLVGRSKLLEHKVPRATVMGHQEEIGAIRGEAMNMEAARKLADILPESATKKVFEDLSKEQVLSPLQRLTLAVEGKRNVQQIVADAVEGKMNDIVAQLLKSKKQAGQVLRTESDVNKMLFNSMNEEIKKLAPKDAKKAKELLESFGISEKGEFKPGALDKFVEWTVMIKLTGLSTHIKNVLGNSSELLLRFPEKFAAGAWDTMLYGLSKKGRNVYAQEAFAEAIGTVKSLKNATHKAWSILVHPTKYLEEATKAGEVYINRGMIGGKLGEVVRSPGRLLGAMDVFFKELNNGAEIYALAARNALKEGYRGAELIKRAQYFIENPTEKMIARASKSALERVFQQPLGNITKYLDKIRQKNPLLRLIVPFFKTPVNLLKRGVQRTPFGAFMFKNLNKAQRIELAGRMTIGTIGLAGLTQYALEGNISAGGPDSKSKRELLRLGGWQPYSIKIGDSWVSYRGFEPMSSWLRTAGDLAEAKISEGEYIEWGTKFGTSYFTQFVENPFLMGVKDILDMTQSDYKVSNFVANMALGATIPVLLQQWGARVFDPTIRKPIRQTGKSLTEKALGQILEEYKARTPILSKQVSPMRNIFGEPIVRQSPISQAFGFTMSYKSDSYLNKELSRLAQLDKGLAIGKPSRNVLGYEMSPEEYDRYLVLTGTLFKESLNKFVNSTQYSRMPDEYRIKTIREIKTEINSMIRNKEFKRYYRGK